MPPGKARIKKLGSDVTVVSYLRVMNEAIAAVMKIDEAGDQAGLLDLRPSSPWDHETVIASVAKTGRCLIIYEALLNA